MSPPRPRPGRGAFNLPPIDGDAECGLIATYVGGVFVDDDEEDPEEDPVEDLDEEEYPEDFDEEEDPEDDREEIELKSDGEDLEVAEVRKNYDQSCVEVCVGRLDRDVAEEEIRSAFRRVGDVTAVQVVREREPGTSFAFVRFAWYEQAQAASQMGFVQVRGRKCEVRRRASSETLFLRYLSKTWSRNELIEKLKAHGLRNIMKVDLPMDKHSKEMNRGYAFIHFCSHIDALNGMGQLHQDSAHLGGLQASFANKCPPEESKRSGKRHAWESMDERNFKRQGYYDTSKARGRIWSPERFHSSSQ